MHEIRISITFDIGLWRLNIEIIAINWKRKRIKNIA